MNRTKQLKINRLNRIRAVQETYKAVKIEGLPDAYIWRKHIYPQYFIGLQTFRVYLGVSVNVELKKLEE